MASLTDAPLPCQMQLCFVARLEPTRMRWENGQVRMTSLKTREASVQECNGVKSVCGSTDRDRQTKTPHRQHRPRIGTAGQRAEYSSNRKQMWRTIDVLETNGKCQNLLASHGQGPRVSHPRFFSNCINVEVPGAPISLSICCSSRNLDVLLKLVDLVDLCLSDRSRIQASCSALS